MENLFLVIRANAFTSRIDDGYLARRRNIDDSQARMTGAAGFPMAKIGATMTAAEIGAYISANPDIRIELLKT